MFHQNPKQNQQDKSDLSRLDGNKNNGNPSNNSDILVKLIRYQRRHKFYQNSYRGCICKNILGIEIDNHLNIQSHVSSICKKAAGQLNALSRLKSFLNQNQRNIIANIFIYSYVNYCPLIWHFCSQSLMNKIGNIQKRTLRFVLNDYTSNYETLLKKSSKCTMEVRRLRVLALEVFRSVNKLNPVYMQSLFEKNVNSKRHKDDLQVPIRNSVIFGDKSVRVLSHTSGTCYQQS